MTLKHFLFDQNRLKIENRKIAVKVQNGAKYACFWHIKRYNNANFKASDLKFFGITFSDISMLHMLRFFENCDNFLENFQFFLNVDFFQNFPKF